MELIETLEGLRRYKGWYRGTPVVRKNAMVLDVLASPPMSKSLGLQPSSGRYAELTRPTVTTLVNSLEEEGLVERINDDEDRRVVCTANKRRRRFGAAYEGRVCRKNQDHGLSR